MILKNLQTYYSGIKPVYIDGLLYVLIALFGAMEATFNSDDAYKYMNVYFMYYAKQVTIWALAIVSALKMFRSTEYGEHVAKKEAEASNVQTTMTQNTEIKQTQSTPPTP